MSAADGLVDRSIDRESEQYEMVIRALSVRSACFLVSVSGRGGGRFSLGCGVLLQ